MYNNEDFGILKGNILTKITGGVGDEEMFFTDIEGEIYRLYHNQDWCEHVDIVDIVGDTNNLIGSPLLMAEEVTSENKNPDGIEAPEYQESFTWTFYKLATVRGYVTIRWYGESNGYYSESVDFVKLSVT